MINQWLTWFNSFLIALTLFIGAAGGIYWLKRPSEIETVSPASKNPGLPKTSFELPVEVYHSIGGSLLALTEAPPTLQVPDLKGQLLYYGKNGRPDAATTHSLLHFALTSNNKNVVSVAPDEPLYLVFDRSTNPGKYVFSPNNEKTSLWVTGSLIGNEMQVDVTFENENGEKITEPASNAHFRLPEKEFNRIAGSTWEIGSYRVDGTLLARQKARWFGQDRFLEHHGGDEFKDTIGKHRIDFSENDEIYSVFVKVGDILVWENNQWKTAEPGINSLGRPIMVVKKIDERLMSFELWDVDGKGKIILNLLKSSEPWTMQNAQMLQAMFKFMGARTRTQSVFEINRERMVLSPGDWLLLTPKGWIKLDKASAIDDYVKRKTIGTLFTFEGIIRKDERQVLKGMLYSPTRHEYQTVELALQSENKARPPKESKEVKDSKDQELKEAKEVADLIGEILAPLTRQEGDGTNNIGNKAPQTGTSKNPTPNPNKAASTPARVTQPSKDQTLKH